jgi:hypothetical protein
VKRWRLAAQLASSGREARGHHEGEFYVGERFAIRVEFADTIDLHSEKLRERT